MSFFKNLFNKQTPNETKYSLSQSKLIVDQQLLQITPKFANYIALCKKSRNTMLHSRHLILM